MPGAVGACDGAARPGILFCEARLASVFSVFISLRSVFRMEQSSVPESQLGIDWQPH